MQPSIQGQSNKLRYVAVFLIGSVVFFSLDIASDIYERVIARSTPSVLDLVHLVFEVFSAAALLVAIRILFRHLRHLDEQNAEQAQSLQFLRGEMDSFTRRKFDEWAFSRAEREIAMFILKGLSIADIAQARATAEGTVKAQTSSIFRKTGVSSRIELMSLFMDEFLDVGSSLQPENQRAVGDGTPAPRSKENHAA